MCSIVLGSNGANKSYQWMIKSSSEHAWYGQKHSISLYLLLPQCQAVPIIIKEGCMKKLVKYYAPRLSEEIYLKWNCRAILERRDAYLHQGVTSPSIQIKEFGIVLTYHNIIISHDSLTISSHELALW